MLTEVVGSAGSLESTRGYLFCAAAPLCTDIWDTFSVSCAALSISQNDKLDLAGILGGP